MYISFGLVCIEIWVDIWDSIWVCYARYKNIEEN